MHRAWFATIRFGLVDATMAQALTQALLEASRALVAVADPLPGRPGRPGRPDVAAVRTLVVLHSTGPLSTTALAGRVGVVHQSTAIRVPARLQRQGLVSRSRRAQGRRLAVVHLTSEG